MASHKFINAPQDAVLEMLDGFLACHPGLTRLDGFPGVRPSPIPLAPCHHGCGQWQRAGRASLELMTSSSASAVRGSSTSKPACGGATTGGPRWAARRPAHEHAHGQQRLGQPRASPSPK